MRNGRNLSPCHVLTSRRRSVTRARMNSAFAGLQKAIQKHHSSGPLRYSEELKAEIIAAVESLRGNGYSWQEVSDEFRIPFVTLQRWIERSKVPHTTTGPVPLRRVEVAESTSRGLAVITKSGLRIEGSVAEIAALIRALG